MSAINLLNTFLQSVSFSRSPFQDSYDVSRLDRRGKDLSDVEGSTLSLSSAFGFVPVFDKDGAVSIYVRLGGPEIIRKGQGLLLSDGLPEIEVSATASTDLANFYGSGASGFRSKYDAVVDGSENLSYAPSLAYERDMIQSAVLGSHPRIPMAQICKNYPFRLVPVGTNMSVEYAVGGAYVPLSEQSAYADLLVGTVNTLLDTIDPTPENVSSVFSIVKSQETAQAVVAALLVKMGEDLKRSADTHILSWEDFADLLSGNSNAYDALYITAFLQLLNKTNVKTESDDFTALMDKVDSVADSLQAVSGSVTSGALEAATAYFVDRSIDPTSIKTSTDATITKLQQANADLRKTNKALESQKKHTSVHRYVGMSAGALSAYMSVRNRDDLQDWQKIGIVAAGGALGLVPVLNYVTIAATPFLVSKGVEYAQRLPSPVSSTRLITAEEV